MKPGSRSLSWFSHKRTDYRPVLCRTHHDETDERQNPCRTRDAARDVLDHQR